MPKENDGKLSGGIVRSEELSHFLGSLAVVYAILILDRALGTARVFLFAKLLDKECYGAYVLAMSFVAVLLPVASLSVPSAFSRYVPEYENRGSLRIFFGRGLGFLTSGTVVVAGLSFLFAAPLSRHIYHTEGYDSLIRLAALSLAFSSFLAFGMASLRGLRRFRATAYIDLFKTALFTFLGVGLLLAIRPATSITALGANAAALGAATLAAATVLWSARRCWPRGDDIEPPGPFAAKLLGFSSAYIGNALLSAGLIFASQWMVNAFGSLGQTGVFGLAMQVAQMLLMLIAAFNLVLSPYLARMWVDGRREESRQALHMVGKITILALLAVSCALLFAAEFLFPRFLPEYTDGLGILRILLAGQLFNASIWTIGQYANLVERPRLKMLATAMAFSSLCAIGFTFAPSCNMTAVAWAFLAAHGSSLVVTLLYSWRLGMGFGRLGVLALGAPVLLALPGWGVIGACGALLGVAVFTSALFTKSEKEIAAQAVRRYHFWKK